MQGQEVQYFPQASAGRVSQTLLYRVWACRAGGAPGAGAVGHGRGDPGDELWLVLLER